MAGNNDFMSVLVDVPEDSVPGVTQLRLRFADNHQTFLVTVPESTKVGDHLRFDRNADGGLRCSIERSEVAPPRSKLASPNDACKHIFKIPNDATPGDTVLAVDLGPSLGPLHVKVPTKATPGDSLVLTLDPASQSWSTKILRNVDPSCEELVLPNLDMDAEAVYNNIVSAVRLAGGSVSHKIKRGTAPPLQILGMVTSDRISAGEEIVCVPQHLHLTLDNCRSVFPTIFEESSSIFFKGNSEDISLSICIAKLIAQAKDAPGMYKITGCGQAPVTKEVERDSGVLTYLYPGHFVRVVEVVDTPDRVRARIQYPEGWISLLQKSNGFRWARKDEGQDIEHPVWSAYAEVLACEDFKSHPIVRSHVDPEHVAAMLEPYCNLRGSLALDGDVKNTYDIISASLDRGLLGEGFTLGAYFQARACMMSRVFDMDAQSVLVPVCDYFNHHPDPGIEWIFDAERQAMVLYAKREHASGEELFISYGSRSNPILFRAYGFTLPPDIEPSWSFTCRGSRIPQDVYNQYLPCNMASFCIQFETTGVHDSLITALNACVANGSDPELFLRSLCSDCIAPYEKDEQLRPLLAALLRARSKDSCSAAWRDEISDKDFSFLCHVDGFDEWMSSMLYIRMSEYLCLRAYLEVFAVMEGRVVQEQCLANAAKIRDTLLSALPILRSGEEVELRRSVKQR